MTVTDCCEYKSFIPRGPLLSSHLRDELSEDTFISIEMCKGVDGTVIHFAKLDLHK